MAQKSIIFKIGIFFFLILLTAAGYLIYLYTQGGEDQYNPPTETSRPPLEETICNLTAISSAVEAYYVKNMEYPEKLELLVPEFLSLLPVTPEKRQAYYYETDGVHRYRISDPDVQRYQLKELYIENGTLTQN